MPQIGPMEIVIVLVIALLVFGPKKLPELGKGLGRGMRDFKRGLSGEDDGDRDEVVAATRVDTPTITTAAVAAEAPVTPPVAAQPAAPNQPNPA